MFLLKRDGRIFHERDVDRRDRQLAVFKAEIDYLRTLVKTQAELITELQSCVDPCSQEGKAICNSLF